MLTKLHRFTGNRIVRVLLIVLALSVIFFAVDYIRVIGMSERPLFCFRTVTADDGGSGLYVGLFYGFDLKGHLPAVDEDGFWVIDQYQLYILGFPVMRNYMS